VTNENSTILSFPAQLELKSKRKEKKKKVIIAIMSAEFVIRVKIFAYYLL